MKPHTDMAHADGMMLGLELKNLERAAHSRGRMIGSAFAFAFGAAMVFIVGAPSVWPSAVVMALTATYSAWSAVHWRSKAASHRKAIWERRETERYRQWLMLDLGYPIFEEEEEERFAARVEEEARLRLEGGAP